MTKLLRLWPQRHSGAEARFDRTEGKRALIFSVDIFCGNRRHASLAVADGNVFLAAASLMIWAKAWQYEGLAIQVGVYPGKMLNETAALVGRAPRL